MDYDLCFSSCFLWYFISLCVLMCYKEKRTKNVVPSKHHLKTSVSYDHSTVEGYVFTPKYYISEQIRLDNNSLSKTVTTYNNYVWDNTLNYNDSWGKHSFGAILAQSMRQEKYHLLTATANNVPEDKDREFRYHRRDIEVL